MSQEERNDAEDRAREERRREDAIVRNRLADAITDTLQSLSSALLNNAKADRVTLQASSFSANFARQSILPADPSTPPPVLNATQAPAALFIDPNASDPAAALGSSGAQGFVLPSNLPALEGLDSVDTTVLHFPVSIRDGGPPPARGQISQVVSPSTSLTLRSNGVEIPVANQNSGSSGGGSSSGEILLATRVQLGESNSSACGFVEAGVQQCNAGASATGGRDVAAVRGSRKGRNAARSSA